MRIVSLGRAEVQDIATDHDRLYIVISGKFFDHNDTATPPRGCVTDKIISLGYQREYVIRFKHVRFVPDGWLHSLR